jgi:transposase
MNDGGLNRTPTDLKKRQHYDSTFKRQAVQQLRESGKPVTEIARTLGIDQSVLHKWKKKIGEEFAPPAFENSDASSERGELLALRQEITEIKSTVTHLRNVIHKMLTDKYLYG